MPRSPLTHVPLAGLAIAVLASAACLSVEDFAGNAPGDAADGGPGSDTGSFVEDAAAAGTYQWQWVNPAPTGRTLYGIGGTSDSDVWVTGEGGTVSHWNGTTWDIRHLGPDTALYYAVGAQKKNDVWVAGQTNDRIDVVHYDGKDWTTSYPFSGSAFGGFSHGPGTRLFAFVDYDILELNAAGTWKSTDTSANVVFGPPADIWVTASGEAWAITTGTKLLHLPAGSQTWELLGPLPGLTGNVAGLSIAGAGSKLCAFYTSRNSSAGTGYLTYDGTWHVGPTSTDPITLDGTPRGSLSACFADGSGMLVYGGNLIVASPTSAPAAHSPFDFANEKLTGAWSSGGATSQAIAVGSLGAFLTYAPGSLQGTENDGTIRKDLLSVDVGLDGTVIAADALEPDRGSGGEVLFYKGGRLVPYAGDSFLPPQIPVGIAVVSANDAWVSANDGSAVGIAHYKDGAWGVTRFLGQMGTPLAIFAPAKDDVWLTADKAAWHYDGTTWNPVTVDATYRGIHGSSPDDVWFAGDAVAHWDGKTLTRVTALKGPFDGVWSSTPGRVWLWGSAASVLWDGKTSTPIATALGGSAEWVTEGVAEAMTGDVFVLTKRATGTALLWFDPTHTKLVEQVSSDLELTSIGGRGNELWAVGSGGAALRFAPPVLR